MGSLLGYDKDKVTQENFVKMLNTPAVKNLLTEEEIEEFPILFVKYTEMINNLYKKLLLTSASNSVKHTISLIISDFKKFVSGLSESETKDHKFLKFMVIVTIMTYFNSLEVDWRMFFIMLLIASGSKYPLLTRYFLKDNMTIDSLNFEKSTSAMRFKEMLPPIVPMYIRAFIIAMYGKVFAVNGYEYSGKYIINLMHFNNARSKNLHILGYLLSTLDLSLYSEEEIEYIEVNVLSVINEVTTNPTLLTNLEDIITIISFSNEGVSPHVLVHNLIMNKKKFQFSNRNFGVKRLGALKGKYNFSFKKESLRNSIVSIKIPERVNYLEWDSNLREVIPIFNQHAMNIIAKSHLESLRVHTTYISDKPSAETKNYFTSIVRPYIFSIKGSLDYLKNQIMQNITCSKVECKTYINTITKYINNLFAILTVLSRFEPLDVEEVKKASNSIESLDLIENKLIQSLEISLLLSNISLTGSNEEKQDEIFPVLSLAIRAILRLTATLAVFEDRIMDTHLMQPEKYKDMMTRKITHLSYEEDEPNQSNEEVYNQDLYELVYNLAVENNSHI